MGQRPGRVSSRTPGSGCRGARRESRESHRRSRQFASLRCADKPFVALAWRDNKEEPRGLDSKRGEKVSREATLPDDDPAQLWRQECRSFRAKFVIKLSRSTNAQKRILAKIWESRWWLDAGTCETACIAPTLRDSGPLSISPCNLRRYESAVQSARRQIESIKNSFSRSHEKWDRRVAETPDAIRSSIILSVIRGDALYNYVVTTFARVSYTRKAKWLRFFAEKLQKRSRCHGVVSKNLHTLLLH